ncbi:MAG: glycosyltransferase [bacterium]|nr:glycosyltransferase [bacterium]
MSLPRIALVCPRLQLPDAIGYDVLHEARVFAEAGYPVKIFAESWSPETPAEPLDRLSRWLRSSGDLLLYHYSVHSPEILNLLRGTDCRRALRYHNVTPAEFLEPYDRGFANALRAGRDLLGAHLAAGVTLALADSEENQRDLLAAGAPPEICTVLAPFHRVPELLAGEADPDWMRALASASDSAGRMRNILMVGRLVPNKGYEHLIRGFAALAAQRQDCRLILAGGQDQRLHVYYRELQSIIEETGVVSRVWLPGSISLAALRALYRTADLLAVTSEHEGFCLPLVEAMAHGVPIAALDRAAVPDTLGDAGLLLDSTEPAYLAAAFQKLLSEPELAQKIGAQGRARYAAQFTNERLAGLLLKRIHEYVSHRPAHSPSSA